MDYSKKDWKVVLTGIGSPTYNVKDGENYVARVLSVNARNDARLIAAAPHMYEALKKLLPRLPKDWLQAPIPPIQPGTIADDNYIAAKAAERAIAKAELANS